MYQPECNITCQLLSGSTRADRIDCLTHRWHSHHNAMQTLVQRMRAAQEAMESEAKEEEFYLQSLLVRV